MGKAYNCIGFIIQATKWLPVLVTCSIFSWGWYAYTFQLALFSMESWLQETICLIVFNILFILAFWSYIQTIFTPMARVPAKFYLSPDATEQLARAPTEQRRDEVLAYVAKSCDLPVACRTYSGAIRYCEKCNIIKPDRAHHCSICRTCVLRMDHHCPWINNCVSFTNYKCFVLFLGYTCFLCLFSCTTTLPYFLKFWQINTISNNGNGSNGNNNQQPPASAFTTRFHILFLFFVSTMISIGLMFLYFYHIHLVLKNRSTLEAFRPPLMRYGPDKNAFNLGRCENFVQVFGNNKLLWFFPVFTTLGSGLAYDQRRRLNDGDEEVRQELLTNNNTHNNNNNNKNDTEV